MTGKELLLLETPTRRTVSSAKFTSLNLECHWKGCYRVCCRLTQLAGAGIQRAHPGSREMYPEATDGASHADKTAKIQGGKIWLQPSLLCFAPTGLTDGGGSAAVSFVYC